MQCVKKALDILNTIKCKERQLKPLRNVFDDLINIKVFGNVATYLRGPDQTNSTFDVGMWLMSRTLVLRGDNVRATRLCEARVIELTDNHLAGGNTTIESVQFQIIRSKGHESNQAKNGLLLCI